ncbi:MAG: hypothetical protein ABI442_13890 [Gemmatimonadaceae bacterium]
MNDALVRLALRSIAVTIATAALIDPGVTSNRAQRPTVVVTVLNPETDASLASDVAKTLNRKFDVVRTPVAAASATVVVGGRPPDTDVTAPAFALLSDTTAPSVSIERLVVPPTPPSESRVPVVARMTLHGARGRSLDVSLSAGASTVDHVARRIAATDTTIDIPLSFVPTAPGAAAVRVTATLSGAKSTSVANGEIDARDRRWPVLFYDPRPSWTSTFVRRALERDPRFVVTSRVETSRGVSTDAGKPPAYLNDLSALSTWDVVVIGAPEGLSADDVTGLDTFMRRRGGSVVLLLDQRVAAPYDRLTGVATWTSRTTTSTSLASFRRDSISLRAAEVVFPSALPIGATIIAGGAQPVVWQTPVGAGRLIVSGALDAWQFRDPSTSGFELFWRQTLADAAAASPPPVTVAASPAILSPGEQVTLHATVRAASLTEFRNDRPGARPVRATLSALLTSIGETGTATAVSREVAFTPDADIGQFVATVRAPDRPGVYSVDVTSGTSAADATFIVSTDVHRAHVSSRDLLGAWVRARGGRAFTASNIDGLSSALASTILPPNHLEKWYPMRSAWWIVPFAFALSAEWWLRRRRELA